MKWNYKQISDKLFVLILQLLLYMDCKASKQRHAGVLRHLNDYLCYQNDEAFVCHSILPCLADSLYHCTIVKLEDPSTMQNSNFFSIVHRRCNKAQTHLSIIRLSPLHCFQAKIRHQQCLPIYSLCKMMKPLLIVIKSYLVFFWVSVGMVQMKVAR